VNDGLQIYVNYFLIVFKMKKITLLFFTFLGICYCRAQERVKRMDTLAAKEKPFVRLYPNPAKNKTEIEIKGFDAGYVKVQLMSSTGKLLREEKRLVLTGNEVIIFMFSENPGLYFLFLKQGKTMVKTKLIIQ
jgi:hypothetical protein